LAGGVGKPGDSYERQADGVADRVVAGESAEDLLGAPNTGAGAGSEAVVQREEGGLIGETASDLWGHATSAWRRLTGGEEEGEGSPTEVSDEVALHALQAIRLAQAATERAAQSRALEGNEQAATQMRELADQLDQRAQNLETGREAFGRIRDAVVFTNDVNEFYQAARTLDSIEDLREDPMRSARAFDNLFGSAGTLAGHLPDGPWQAYFQFLTHFRDQGGFFQNMTAALSTHTRGADQVLGEQGEERRVAEPAVRSNAAPSGSVSLANMDEDIERQIEAARENITRGSYQLIQSRFREFRSLWERLRDLVTREDQLWFYQRTELMVVRMEIRDAAAETAESLQSLEQSMVTPWDMSDSLDRVSRPDLGQERAIIDRYLHYRE
jgi:plasmid stabilization system protein ParE